MSPAPPPRRRFGPWAARVPGLALALALALATACAGPWSVVSPGRPSGQPGLLAYDVGDLTVLAPEAWRAVGGGRLALEAPGGRARLEVTLGDEPHPGERECLAAADGKLSATQATLERARRHPTRFAGRPGLALEADRGGWHVWAVAACDGGVQYRVFFTAATPASREVLEAWRTLLATARLGGAG